MKYVNAKDVLPPEILSEVQKYTTGALIYVPKTDKIGWGQLSGARAEVLLRNQNIMTEYQKGASIYELMKQYCLSEASIRKIVYSRKVELNA